MLKVPQRESEWRIGVCRIGNFISNHKKLGINLVEWRGYLQGRRGGEHRILRLCLT